MTVLKRGSKVNVKSEPVGRGNVTVNYGVSWYQFRSTEVGSMSTEHLSLGMFLKKISTKTY
jgi:hypothetical protein